MAGTRVERTVSLIDLPATIAHLAGVSAGDIPGKTLVESDSVDGEGLEAPAFAAVDFAPHGQSTVSQFHAAGEGAL